MVSSALHGIFVSPGYVYNSRVLFFFFKMYSMTVLQRGEGQESEVARSLARSLSSKQQFYRKPVWAAAPPEVKEALFQRRRGGEWTCGTLILFTPTPPPTTHTTPLHSAALYMYIQETSTEKHLHVCRQTCSRFCDLWTTRARWLRCLTRGMVLVHWAVRDAGPETGEWLRGSFKI